MCRMIQRVLSTVKDQSRNNIPSFQNTKNGMNKKSVVMFDLKRNDISGFIIHVTILIHFKKSVTRPKPPWQVLGLEFLF